MNWDLDTECLTDLAKARVLVVDDDEIERQLIGAYLEIAGIETVDYATDGEEGLAAVERFDPDLVILDIVMPRMNGFEMCRRLRSNPRHRHLAILVQTALESPADRTAVFQAGATDCIIKPIHAPELIARVRVHLENCLLIRDLERYRADMAADLDLARRMQEGIMPTPAQIAGLADRAGLCIDATFRPSAELGGDMWTLHELDAERVGVAMIDFSGHGVSAALNTFRLHTAMHDLPLPVSMRPSAYLRRLNALLLELLPLQQFATMFYGIVDSRNGSLTFAGAGVPEPLLTQKGETVPLDASGLPLGIVADPGYVDRTVGFSPGASLLLYSDALVETPDEAGALLGVDGLRTLLRDVWDGGCASPLPELLRRFQAGFVPSADDLTVVWLARRA